MSGIHHTRLGGPFGIVVLPLLGVVDNEPKFFSDLDRLRAVICLERLAAKLDQFAPQALVLA